jgi:hypothetical protein
MRVPVRHGFNGWLKQRQTKDGAIARRVMVEEYPVYETPVCRPRIRRPQVATPLLGRPSRPLQLASFPSRGQQGRAPVRLASCCPRFAGALPWPRHREPEQVAIAAPVAAEVIAVAEPKRQRKGQDGIEANPQAAGRQERGGFCTAVRAATIGLTVVK